jgi:RNA polymerase sigma-70 factor, ECF subfamily
MSESMPKEPKGPALDEVIRLVHQGDREAFGLIYRNYSELVYRVCFRMLRDPSEAEDAAQDVFVRVFLKINTFRGESAFSSWLYRVTMNVVLMRFRSRRNKFKYTSLGGFTEDDGDSIGEIEEIGAPDLHLSGLLGWIDLQAAIDVLPDGYKTAFILHDVHGYEHKEIAAIFGYSVGNSKSQLYKARKRLRKLLAHVPRRGHLDPSVKAVCVN